MARRIFATVTLALFFGVTAFADKDWNAGPGGFGDEEAPPPRAREFRKSGEGGGAQGRPGMGRRRGPGGPGGPGGKEVVEACASSLGIAIPEKGSETKLSDSDKSKLHECVKAKIEEKKAAMKACLEGQGVTFDENGKPSSRPSKEQMDACRDASSSTDTATDTSTTTETETSNTTSAI
jgi:hypothetical protein